LNNFRLLPTTKHVAFFFSLLLFLPSSTALSATSTTLYSKLHAASVEILVDGHLAGSGWFASPQGLIFTAAHLIKGLPEIEIISPVAGRMPAFLVATDLAADLALLKVRRGERYFPSLSFAPQLPTVGDTLYLFGAPAYRHAVMVQGIVAKAAYSYEWNVQNHGYTKVFTLQAMTAEGFSGAPWVNEQGEVVGVQSGMLAWRGQLMGLAFASPVEAARQLIATKQSSSVATLGAALAETWEAADKGLFTRTGLKILQLETNSSLRFAGMRTGAVVLEFNGQSVSYRDELLDLVRREKPGTEVELKIGSQSGDISQQRIQLGCLGLGCPIKPR
jgi:S1-C subfamily serine protease